MVDISSSVIINGDEYDSNDIVSTYQYAYIKFGSEINNEPERLGHILADLAPKLGRDIKLLVLLCKNNHLKRLMDKQPVSDADLIIWLDNASGFLVQQEYIDENIAWNLCMSLINGLKGKNFSNDDKGNSSLVTDENFKDSVGNKRSISEHDFVTNTNTYSQERVSELETRILLLVKRIDRVKNIAETNYSAEACDLTEKYLIELKECVEEAKKKRLRSLPINNTEIKKEIKRIRGLKKESEKKEKFHREMYDVNNRISDIEKLQNASPKQWNELIELVHQLLQMESLCSKNNWPLPQMTHSSFAELINQYTNKIDIVDLDDFISNKRKALHSKKQYQRFYDACKRQEQNFNVCIQYGWTIPNVINLNLDEIINEVKCAERKRRKRIKLITILSTFVIIAVLSLVGVRYSILKSHEGKIQIPFGSGEVVRKEKYSAVITTLRENGFTNINMIEDSSGWLNEGVVTGIVVDKDSSFTEGSYYSPDAEIKVKYSSRFRQEISNFLSDWQQMPYVELVETLQRSGFTAVSTLEKTTTNKTQDNLIAQISFSGDEYVEGDAYLPLDASVVISYYIYKSDIDNEYIGQDYKDVIDSLKTDGFLNITSEQVNTGFKRGNSVVDILINDAPYEKDFMYTPETPILVKYSSNDRIDISDCLVDWNKIDFRELEKELEGKGFEKIIVNQNDTTKKSQNLCLSSISFDNEQFIEGDCFVQISRKIELQYYRWKINLSESSKKLCDYKDYSKLVEKLKEKGFSNIVLKRANNLKTGWLTKEGSVNSITINGQEKFEDDQSFYFDDEIVIIVNTFKDKGVEDITEAL